ncbi:MULTISPECIES: hypothetical protein [Sphingobacterium]|uniref:hypothetical protein n=1 Tax=Sphingobacterium TaxID=28453 RepID=UPI00257E0B79|nr:MULTISPECIES: hypothetical protein [Sphingobacterium]
MTTQTTDLSTLVIDREFLDRSYNLGIITVEDIMKINLPKLRKKEYFTYLWYFNLLALLEANGLLDEFEEKHL